MLSLTDVVAQHCALSDDDTGWLVGLTDQWDMLADLSFSDLILWVPDVDDNVFWAAAQCRPTTGPTALEDDVVGEEIAYDPEHLVTEAYLSREIAMTSGNKLHAGIPVDVHAVPVLREGRCIGIVELHTNRMGVRAPGALEDTYLEVAGLLLAMVHRAEFPVVGHAPVPFSSPRVGDGAFRVSEDGTVTFASPNAVSAFRRLGWAGDVLGENFTGMLTALMASRREPVEEVTGPLLGARRARETEVETRAGIVRLRSMPLCVHDAPHGWLVLCRDTTDLRTRERQLVTKDATIREIHHRVKNNLQTVAALLRLQTRRTSSAEAIGALSDAQKRVSAIAVVHEILSQGFDASVRFDDVADRLMAMVRDVANTGVAVAMERRGSFGLVPADVATHLSLVLTEVLQNALEHGVRESAGHVVVQPRRSGEMLVVDVTNDGLPLPDGFDLASSHSLGLSIVTALVKDLSGTFELSALPDTAGTLARITLPLS
ncbi:sensor histidine kinase [Propioniciclava soli]|uniref:histidine kinase n=1 Tax=Propioniciclava soli TaxID=2775081 RepID=A0ABZ3C2T1_9ACTN